MKKRNAEQVFFDKSSTFFYFGQMHILNNTLCKLFNVSF